MLEGVFGLSPVHLLCIVRFQLLPQGHNIVGSISAGNNISIRMIATCDTTLVVRPAVAAAAAAAADIRIFGNRLRNPKQTPGLFSIKRPKIEKYHL